ncbi:MAG: sigma 54-interacting transcriptional regulator [Firmicutes bacterium]|nr:sigma 54-interacting transcriptional regulator [Bacillota bacterium]
MDLRKEFKDVCIVDSGCRIEYIRVAVPEFFGYKPENLIGKKFTQFYTNIDGTTSTLARAIHNGERFVDYVQYLENDAGRMVKQIEDIYLIKDGEKVLGAIEFADYDVEKDIILSKKEASLSQVDDDERPTMDSMIGQSQQISQIKKKIHKMKDTDAPILIMGESGTGKELLARVIHNLSQRKDKPFIYINCSALPENLLEGILFGTKKGSFTDAEEKKGLFQAANGGTLFLDEVDSMPLGIQPKILRTIEEKCVRPIGGTEEQYLDVRIMASCNKEMDQLLKLSTLRNDLVFRLSVLQFFLPPLRERGEDILLIADYYRKQYNRMFKKDVREFSPDLKKLFINHKWPGNVRELKNVMEGVYPLINHQVMGEEDLRNHWLKRSGDVERKRRISQNQIREFRESKKPLKDYLEEREQKIIRQTLEACGGIYGEAAKALGISPQLLKYKLTNRNREL